MNRWLLIYALFCFLGKPNLIAQKIFFRHNLKETNKLKSEIDKEAYLFSQKTSVKYSSEVNKGVISKDFVDAIINSKKERLYSQLEYQNIDSVNSYLKSILLKIYPKGNDIKINVIRDAYINASAFEDSSIYLNVGLLSRLTSEAQIASVLGHELGHILKNHFYSGYSAHSNFEDVNNSGYEITGFTTMLARFETSRLSKKLINQEKEADVIGWEFLKKSGFNTLAAAEENELFLNSERNYTVKNRTNTPFNAYSLRLRTHPRTENRLDRAKKLEICGTKNFIIDSLYFFKVKKWANDEVINLYFESYEFKNCIELAFPQFLRNPTDPYYLFYLTESLRRLALYDSTSEDKTFITDRYQPIPYHKTKETGRVYYMRNKKLKTGKRKKIYSILYQLPFTYASGLDSFEINAIKSNKLQQLDTLPFYTYGDALNYFTDACQKLSSPFNLYVADNMKCVSEKSKDTLCHLKQSVSEYYSKPKTNKYLFILYNLNHYYNKNGVYSFETPDDSIHEKLNKLDSLHFLNFLNNTEIHLNNKLKEYVNVVSSVITDKMENAKFGFNTAYGRQHGKTYESWYLTTKQVSFPVRSISPEIIATLNDLGYDGIIFSDLNMYYRYVSSSVSTGNFIPEDWSVKHYILNAKEQILSYYRSRMFNHSMKTDPLSDLKFSGPAVGGTIKLKSDQLLFKKYYHSIQTLLH